MAAQAYLFLTPLDQQIDRHTFADYYALGSWFPENFSEPFAEKKLQQIPYEFLEEEKRRAAYDYCEQIAESVLDILVPWLNFVHQTNFSSRTWRMQCGFFLVSYTQALYERYVCLKTAHHFNPNFTTTLVAPSAYQTPNNYLEYAGLCGSHDFWNHQLFSQIIDLNRWFPNRTYAAFLKPDDISINSGPGLGYQQPWTTNLKRGLISAINNCYPVAPIMFYVGNMAFWGRANLMGRSGGRLLQMLPLARQLAMPTALNLDLRASMPETIPDEFACLVLHTLRTNFPKCWLEDFHLIRHHANSFSLKNRLPRLIVSDTGWYANEAFQLWSGLCAEQGTRLVGVQHGGGYGDRLINTSEIHERKCMDYYITWGWKEDITTIPLPSLKLQRTQKSHRPWGRRTAQPLTILLTSTGFPRYVSSFESSQCASQWEEYREWQWRFIAALEVRWQKHLVVRLYHWDYGRNTYQLYRQKFANLTIVNSSNHRDFSSHLRSCSLFIADNMGTTMLEALACNIPTLMFWQTKDWPSRKAVLPRYQQLHHAQVFHHSPESAAAHANGILPTPQKWWETDATKAAVSQFENHFALTSKDWGSQWVGKLLELSRLGTVHGDRDRKIDAINNKPLIIPPR